MQASDCQSLLKHMEWADALIWKTVLKLHDAQRDGPLLNLLYHLHSVQWAFLQVWRDEPLRVPELSSFSGLPAVANWARPCYPQLRAFVQNLDTGLLTKNIEFPWAAEVAERFGPAGPTTLGESILQVVLHSTYHRGQVATRVREAGGEPPLTDFIAWLWKGRPDPEW
jgi:uncharacterized damage-inducible protein DinB